MPNDLTPLLIILIALLLGGLVLGLTRWASIRSVQGSPTRRWRKR